MEAVNRFHIPSGYTVTLADTSNQWKIVNKTMNSIQVILDLRDKNSQFLEIPQTEAPLYFDLVTIGARKNIMLSPC